MDIYNAIMNIDNSVTDIYNCIMGTNIETIAIMDIHKLWMSIMIFCKSIIVGYYE